MNQKEQDLAVLAYLTGRAPVEAADNNDSPATPRLPHDDVDTGLRALGLNRIERERVRRSAPRPRNETKYRAITVKRFEYHIGQVLPGRTPEQIAGLAAVWVGLTNYDLDGALRWWAAGIDPGKPEQLVAALNKGFQAQDFAEVVAGRTIAEHLQAGNSLDWCLAALHWRRSA